MLFRQITDPHLAQYAYLIGCQKTGEALVIDPERDVDRYLDLVEQEGLTLTAVAETHIHADFLSGARELAERTGTKLYLSAEGEADGWGSNWAKGAGYDVTFLRDGDTFMVGNIEIKAVHTPGHTPEHLSFLVTDHGGGASEPMGIASGDFVFVGDLGRPDLLEQAAGLHGVQEPSARRLYHSLDRFTDLPAFLQVWPGHGAGSACGKALGAVPQSTVGYEVRFNASLDAARRGEDAFVGAILGGQPEPPMYFARMKQQNRDGVPLLGTLPQPDALDAASLADVVKKGEATVLDTRLDRSAVMQRHVPGALYTPLNKSFNTAVGSLVTDPETPLVLVVDEAAEEGAVRDLVRIGYDRVVGFVTPEVLEDYFADGNASASIPEIGFDEVERRRDEDGVAVLDVRYASEYAAAHVPGAVNASYTRLPAYTDRVPAGKTLLVHCQSGARSAVAASYLAREGHDVRYVSDDIADYASRYETESGEPVAA